MRFHIDPAIPTGPGNSGGPEGTEPVVDFIDDSELEDNEGVMNVRTNPEFDTEDWQRRLSDYIISTNTDGNGDPLDEETIEILNANLYWNRYLSIQDLVTVHLNYSVPRDIRTNQGRLGQNGVGQKQRFAHYLAFCYAFQGYFLQEE